MNAKKIFGLLLLILGLYLIVSPVDKENCDRAVIRKEFSGYTPKNKQKSMIAGIVLAITGGCLLVLCRGKKE